MKAKNTKQKSKQTKEDSSAEFEHLRKDKGEKYELRLFVAGMSPRSTMATMNIKKICEENLKGRYKLEVIDIYQQPELAKNGEILAAPTLLKMRPFPTKKLIGDFSNTARVLIGLNLCPKQ